jgi:hypothetical protein
MTIEEILKNKDVLIAQKKATIKLADPIRQTVSDSSKKLTTVKAELNGEDMEIGVLKAELVINTTNIIDSHMDCHINGLWNKSIKEQKTIFLLQEHDMCFSKIIADSVNDNLKASAKDFAWSDLGFNFKGTTQALVFNTDIKEKRNEFMYNQYKNNYVLNHSVGMRYQKLYLCVNSDNSDYTAEKEAWDKYYPMVVNKEVADTKGYFWAVTEAQFIEGSAVVKGSNYVTPVLSITENKNIPEPSNDTQENEPTKVTQTEEQKQFFINLLSK